MSYIHMGMSLTGIMLCLCKQITYHVIQFG